MTIGPIIHSYLKLDVKRKMKVGHVRCGPKASLKYGPWLFRFFARSRAVSTLTYLEGPCPFLFFELCTHQNIISLFFIIKIFRNCVDMFVVELEWLCVESILAKIFIDQYAESNFRQTGSLHIYM